MSPRKLVQIADPPALPTIKDYFGMMAEEQRDDILRLKQAASGKKSGETQAMDNAVPDPWLMHPIRPAKRAAAKRDANASTRSASKKSPKKAAKKATKKASKKARP
jgi:hypothetical protein